MYLAAFGGGITAVASREAGRDQGQGLEVRGQGYGGQRSGNTTM